MLLKRVKYHNFRPFIGNQEIVFTQDTIRQPNKLL